MPRRVVAFVLLAGLTAAVAACGGTTGGTPSPGRTAEAPATPAGTGPTSVPGGGGATAAAPATFTTPWGEAWDRVPEGFPVPPGARRAEPGDPVEGPVSGAWVVEGPASDAALQMWSGLRATGYRVDAPGGPLEDGSFVADAVGRDPACRVQVRVRPLGGTTLITVLLGAACPLG